jgi:hypothetical protein
VNKLLVLALLVGALGLAGCASDTSDAEPSHLGTVLSGPAVSPSPSARSATPTPTPTPTYIRGAASIYLLGDANSYAWIAPSRNIACGIVPTYYQNSDNHTMWGCEVDQHTWKTPGSKPGDYCYNAQVPCGTGVAVIDGQTPTPSMHGCEERPRIHRLAFGL